MLSGKDLQMIGTLDMSKNRIVNIGSNVDPLEAVGKSFADNNYVRKDSDQVIRGNISTNSNSKKYVNVLAPIKDNDIATKEYVDTKADFAVNGNLVVNELIVVGQINNGKKLVDVFNIYLANDDIYRFFHGSPPQIDAGSLSFSKIENLSGFNSDLDYNKDCYLARISDIRKIPIYYSKLKLRIKDPFDMDTESPFMHLSIFGESYSFLNVTAKQVKMELNLNIGNVGSFIVRDCYHKIYSPNFFVSNFLNITYYGVENNYMLLSSDYITQFDVYNNNIYITINFPVLSYNNMITPSASDIIEITLADVAIS